MSRLYIEPAAARHQCSTLSIRRLVANGSLPAVAERVLGSHGRPVKKLMIAESDLDAEFAPKPAGPPAHEAHARGSNRGFLRRSTNTRPN